MKLSDLTPIERRIIEAYRKASPDDKAWLSTCLDFKLAEQEIDDLPTTQ